MYLVDIKEFIAQHGMVTMFDLTQKFKLEHQTMRLALEELQRMGVIERINSSEVCCSDFKGCGSCVKLDFEIYKIISK